MLTKKLFLASSAELADDRREFEIFINRKNKDWVARDVFLELVVWEDFLDALSPVRLQDEYNKAIGGCDIFVMLFCTKVGRYTQEEFATAFKQFEATKKPFIFTYFREAQVSTGSADRADLNSLWTFQDKLKELGHFQTAYKNTDALKFHFNQQLDKLAAAGFIEFKPEQGAAAAPAGDNYQATLTGSGAIAQGRGAQAVGAGGVLVGGNNSSNINTGTQSHTNSGGGTYIGGSVHTGGGDFVGRDQIKSGLSPYDLEALFAPLLVAVAQHAPAAEKTAAVQQVQQLKTELAQGPQAADDKVGTILDGLAAMVPAAIGAIVSAFASPLLAGVAGPVTKFVLNKLRGS